jgi:hypothetical protein
MTLTNKTAEELKQELSAKEKQFEDVAERLALPGISDDTVRALLKTKNELYADIQTYRVELAKRSKPFSRSLNESFEL